MILGYTNEEIVKIALEHQSDITDGVTQYNYKSGKLMGASFTTGTVENPNLPVIEIFRLPNTNRVIIHDVDTFCENGFDDEWEYSFKESVEQQIRDVLSDHLSDTISKLNDIRIAISDIIASYDYFNIRQDDWEMRVLDSYVDNAIENGFVINCEPADYLDAEVSYIAELTRYNNKGDVDWNKISQSIEEYDFDRALELL